MSTGGAIQLVGGEWLLVGGGNPKREERGSSISLWDFEQQRVLANAFDIRKYAK